MQIVPTGRGASWRRSFRQLLAPSFFTSFTTVVGSANYTFDPAANADAVTLPFGAASYRYWRVTITANTGWPAGQISEVQVWNQ